MGEGETLLHKYMLGRWTRELERHPPRTDRQRCQLKRTGVAPSFVNHEIKVEFFYGLFSNYGRLNNKRLLNGRPLYYDMSTYIRSSKGKKPWQSDPFLRWYNLTVTPIKMGDLLDAIIFKVIQIYIQWSYIRFHFHHYPSLSLSVKMALHFRRFGFRASIYAYIVQNEFMRQQEGNIKCKINGFGPAFTVEPFLRPPKRPNRLKVARSNNGGWKRGRRWSRFIRNYSHEFVVLRNPIPAWMRNTCTGDTS